MSADLLRWSSGGVLNWIPSLLRVPSLNGLSQRWQYIKIDGGGGGGGSGGGGGGGGATPRAKKSNLNTKVKNPN